MADENLKVDDDNLLDDLSEHEIPVEPLKKEPKEDKEEDPTEKALKDLKKQAEDQGEQLKKANARNAQLEKEKNEAVKTRAASQEDQLSAYEQKFSSEIESSSAQIKMLNQQKKAALEAGDNDKVIELDEELFDARTALKQAQHGKTQVEDLKKKREAAPAPEENNDLTPAAQAWVDAHPKFDSDPEYKADAVAAHSAAVARGIKVDSKAYFDFIDKRMAVLYPENTGDEPASGEEEPSASKKSPQSTAAPTSRAPAGGAGKPAKGKLTAEEVEAAGICGMTPDEYWQDKYGNKGAK